MKNSEIVAAYSNLMELMKREEKYPVKFSYALTRNVKKLEPLVKDFEKERDKLLDQYNEKENDEPSYKKSGKIKIAKEHQEAWAKELEELLEIEVEFSPHVLPVEDLPEKIETAVLYFLDFMIKE